MKRSGPPERRTPLRRGKPLSRSSVESRGDGPTVPGSSRSPGPLRAVSAKRAGEGAERRAAVAAAVSRWGSLCVLGFVEEPPCGGPLFGHEVVHRSVRPGSHLEPGLIVPLCQVHNGWETTLPVVEAEMVGARAVSWAAERHGVEVVAAELGRIRSERAAGRVPEPPLWRV